MPFLKNQWYAAAWCDEIAPGEILSRKILGETVAIYRSGSGKVAILFDRCPHRLLPLSCGQVRGENVECGYHGITFDSHGDCVRIPGQAQVPANARVRSYPALERHGVIWIWPGSPELAGTSDIFDVIHSESADWSRGQVLCTFATNYLNVTDNLVDPAHTSFVHQRTLGGSAAADIPLQTGRDGGSIVVSRWIENSPPVPMMEKYFNFRGNVDRWQYYYWHRPAVMCVDFGAIDAELPRTQVERDRGFRIYSYSFLTPEDETSTHFFSLQLRNFAVGDEDVSRQLVEDFKLTYEEDRVILERIQQVQNATGATHEIRLGLDAAAVQVRHTYAKMLDEECALATG